MGRVDRHTGRPLENEFQVETDLSASERLGKFREASQELGRLDGLLDRGNVSPERYGSAQELTEAREILKQSVLDAARSLSLRDIQECMDKREINKQEIDQIASYKREDRMEQSLDSDRSQGADYDRDR